MIVGCARESTQKTVQDQAFEYQIERLKAYGCEKIYQDRESGRKDYRKTHDEIITGIRAGEIQEVVATSMSRLGRSVLAVQRIIASVIEAQKAGMDCKLTLLDGEVKLDSAMGRAFLLQQAVFAQMESEMIGERAVSGWANLRRLGKASRPVWGYVLTEGVYNFDRTENDFNTTAYEISQGMIDTFFKAKKLRSILKFYQEFYPFLLTKNKLYDMCPRCPRSASGISAWLTSETLLGDTVFRQPYLLFSGTHEAYLTLDQHKQIKEILSHNQKHHGWQSDQNVNPFAGLVRCQVCGKLCSMSGNKDRHGVKKYRYYRCANRDFQCSEKKRIEFHKLEYAVHLALVAQADRLAQEGAALKSKPVAPTDKEAALQGQLDLLNVMFDYSEAIEGAKRQIQSDLNVIRLNKQNASTTSYEHLFLLESYRNLEFWQSLQPNEKPTVYRSTVESVWLAGGLVVSVDLRF